MFKCLIENVGCDKPVKYFFNNEHLHAALLHSYLDWSPVTKMCLMQYNVNCSGAVLQSTR